MAADILLPDALSRQAKKNWKVEFARPGRMAARTGFIFRRDVRRRQRPVSADDRLSALEYLRVARTLDWHLRN
jgi:hypothetical protein